MLSPYSNKSIIDSGATMVEVFIGKDHLKLRERVVFSAEQFEQLAELLQEMFQPEESSATITFKVEDCKFKIEKV